MGLSQLLESSYTLCWAAKWYGGRDTFFDSVNQSTPKQMVKGIHKLMDQADAIVHYNGSRFDIPTLNKEFILNGLTPPAPAKQIDLLKISRNRFRFPSNRLDYVANALGLGSKSKHEGHTLWIKCMAGDKQAWREMESYNRNDVVLLEKVYDKFKPWIKGAANHSVFAGKVCCPNCGSEDFHRRGYAYTAAAKYQRFECQSCGTWFRSGKSVAVGPNNKSAII